MIKSMKNYFGSLQRSTSSGKFIPFVDGLRFLAIMPVVLQHASERLMKYNPNISLMGWEEEAHFLISRGAIGVFIFFALSGFILSLPFAGKPKPFNYGKYLGRRLTRLEPPYIFWMSLFAVILLIQSNIPLGQLIEHWIASLFYVHTAAYGEFSIINPVAWSLEVEIQYYLLAPFMAMAYFRQPDVKFRRWALIVLMILFLGYQHAFGWQVFPIKASILGHLQHFLIGMLMADLYKNETDWVNKKHVIWDFIAPIAILVMAYTWTEQLGKTIIMNMAMAAIFLAAFKGKYFVKFLSIKWITVIGGMCYTIYLIHLPILELVYSLIGDFGQSSDLSLQLSISLIIALPVVLISSVIGYKTIEQPFMKRKPITFESLQHWLRSLTPTYKSN
jgi:peptidoglycan/LPS O-acetylase OafA/YrhL